MNLKSQFMCGIDNSSKYPSLDCIFPHRNYTITINPNPEIEPEFKVVKVRQLLELTILPLFRGNVIAYTEISTKNINIHYHGFINWDSYLDISEFYLNIIEIRKYCQFEVDNLMPEYSGWWMYCLKSCPHMDALCHSYKIANKIKYKYNNNRINYTIKGHKKVR